MKILKDIIEILINEGASLVGFANLKILKPEVKRHFSTGISIAIALNPNVVTKIKNGPTLEYYHEYLSVNKRLDHLSSVISSFLNRQGYKTDYWGATESRIYGHYMTVLPHKTIATLSGLGWIGKCALLITKQFGSAIRLTSVLTDIIIENNDNSIIESSCGDCTICVKVCPGHAPKGINWRREIFRDDFFNVDLCRDTAKKLSKERIGIDNTICGICIGNCKYTQNYLHSIDFTM